MREDWGRGSDKRKNSSALVESFKNTAADSKLQTNSLQSIRYCVCVPDVFFWGPILLMSVFFWLHWSVLLWTIGHRFISLYQNLYACGLFSLLGRLHQMETEALPKGVPIHTTTGVIHPGTKSKFFCDSVISSFLLFLSTHPSCHSSLTAVSA